MVCCKQKHRISEITISRMAPTTPPTTPPITATGIEVEPVVVEVY